MATLKRYVTQGEWWQVFCVFVIVFTIYSVIPVEFIILRIISTTFLSTIIFGWFMIIGISLNGNLRESQQKNDTLFILSCLYGVSITSLSAVYQNTPPEEAMDIYIILLIVIVFGASFMYIVYFTSSLFSVSQERLKKEDRLTPEVIYILFITFVIGIFFLQPKIKKIFN